MGAMADSSGTHKRFLVIFALIGQGMTAALVWIPEGEWFSAAVVYALATLGFMGGNIFYDALLVEVAPSDRYDLVSALGFALGYLGGGLLFTLCILMSLFPSSFGFEDSVIAVRFSFFVVALWWLLFSLPIFLWVHGPIREKNADTVIQTILKGFRQVRNTVTHIRELRMVALFLVAYWLYIDGVDTIVRMAVDYGRALGFSRDDLILALLITQFVGFPAAIVFGYLGERLGTKQAIYAAIGVYIIVTAWGSMMQQTWEFFGIAIAIGLVQGGIQSLSRAFYARLIPAGKAAEFFGFYNMLGKFAAVVGPVMVGSVGVLTNSPRLGILSVLILFITGGVVLYFVESGSSTSAKPLFGFSHREGKSRHFLR